MTDDRIIDGHVHINVPGALENLRQYAKQAKLEALGIASIGCIGDGCAPEQNLLALILKREEPTFYAYGSLVYPALPVPEALRGRWAPHEQAQALLAAGCDGMKLLESKPGYRKKLGTAMSDKRFDAFWRYLEEARTPVLWHVADPETFWSLDEAPQFAINAGWTYTDGTYPTKAQLTDETLAVLGRYPGLRVALAHFFFLSAFEAEARALMEQYPNVSLDITPGIEMYENFSKAPARWRAFFTQYHDRIIFGTDHEDGSDPAEGAQTTRNILRFLSTEDAFTFWQSPVRGIGLAPDAVRAIMCSNFVRRSGPKPKPVNDALLAALIDQWIDAVRDTDTRAYIAAYRETLG